MPRFARQLGACILWMCSACSTPEPQTQLLVWLRASAELARVRVDVYPGSERDAGAEPRGADFKIASGSPKAGEHTLPLSFVVLPGESERVELVARGFATRDAAAEPIAEQRTSAKFEPGVTLEINLMLRTLGFEPEPEPEPDSGLPPRCEGDAICDPVAQCGCIAPAHCQLTDNSVTCAAAGGGKDGELCRLNQDCGSGLSCAAGACRAVCRSDADCDDTAQCVRRTKDATFGFCAEPCAVPNAPKCREGLLCTPVEVGDVADSFCLRLESPCTTRSDAVCDEPGPAGSGFCATDTDAEDCCARKHGFDRCDPITNCGCPEGLACRVVGRLGESASTQCRVVGDRPIGARCDNDAQCGEGSDCAASGMCSRFCKLGGTDAQCDEGDDCWNFRFSGVEVTDIGYCRESCTKETAQQDCREGTVCAQILTGMFCYVQPAMCPMQQLDNGVCDETFTNLCAPGTDSDADCGR